MSRRRYRAVEVAMWGHHRFRYMSRPEPCGQFLWLYLLTNPDTGMIPGLYRAGEATLAEGLGWELGPRVSEAFREGLREAFREGRRPPTPKTFREALAEIEEQGLVVIDSDSRIVWIPGAIEHNRPGNPNIVKSFARDWRELPDCPLKAEAWVFIRDFLSRGFAPSFLRALEEACPKPFSKPFAKHSAKPSANGSPNKREERREKRIEEDPPCSPPAGDVASLPPLRKSKGKKQRQLSAAALAVQAEIRERLGVDYPPAAFDALEARLQARELSPEDALALARWACGDPFWGGETKASPSTIFRPKHFAELLAKAKANPAKVRPLFPGREPVPDEYARLR